MSDTVKVLIEIPKEIYERCKEYKLWSYDAETLEGAVAQGIPLDDDSERVEVRAYFVGEAYGWKRGRKALIEDVKAEIMKLEMEDCCDLIYRGEVIHILDNIEREDK